MIKVATGANIGEIIGEMPDRMEVDEVTGDYDLIVKFTRDNSEKLNKALDRIRGVEGVEETKTYTVLKSRTL